MRGGAKPGNRGKWAEEILTPGFAEIPSCTIIKTSAPVRILKGAETRKVGGRRTISGFIEKKGACDYEGGFRGFACAIEAKRWDPAARDRWNFKSSIAEHQQDRMAATMRMGGIAGVLLCVDAINPRERASWFGIEWLAIASAIDSGSKSFSIGDLYYEGKLNPVTAHPGSIARIPYLSLSRIDLDGWLVDIYNRAQTRF